MGINNNVSVKFTKLHWIVGTKNDDLVVFGNLAKKELQIKKEIKSRN